MDVYEIILAAVVIFLTLVAYKFFLTVRQWKRLPPGPWGVPVLGYQPFLGKNPHLKLMELQDVYGNLLCFNMGNILTVCIEDMETFKETIVNQAETFAGRPDFYSILYIKEFESLVYGNYSERWKVQRKTAVNALRMYSGDRGSCLWDIVTEGAKDLTTKFLANEGKRFNAEPLVFTVIGNIILQILQGKHTDISENKEFYQHVLNTRCLTAYLASTNKVDFIPWTRFFAWNSFKRFVSYMRSDLAAWKTTLLEHLESFDKSHIRDVTDALLASYDISDIRADPNHDLFQREIPSTLMDMFNSGFDSVANTITWSILYMVVYPEIQERVQNEVDSLIGGRNVTIDDKRHLPFTDATVLEILRQSSVVPLSVSRRTIKDCQVKEYFIPKDSAVWINIWAINRDRKLWKDPETFRPERFLTDSGVIDGSTRDSIVPFSGGRRRCPGEFIARDEVFLLFATLLQKCSLKKVEGAQYHLNGQYGLTMAAPAFELEVIKRY